jgi:hypothetical protein
MTLKIFIEEYNYTINWLVSKLENKNNITAINKSLFYCYSFMKAVINKYTTKNDLLALNYNQLHSLCKEYIANAKKENQASLDFAIISYSLFSLCERLRYYYPKSIPSSFYVCFKNQMSVNFIKTNSIDDGGYVCKPIGILTYRHVNWPVYWDENGSQAYTLHIDKNNITHTFSLDWDWYYNIDNYLDVIA